MGPPLWCTAQRHSRRHSAQSAHTVHKHYLMYTDTLYMLSTWCMYVCTASSLCRLVTLLCACAALPLLYVGVLYVTRLTPACMHTLLVLLSLMNVTTPHVTTVNRWKGTTITAQKLCSGDWDRTLYFTVWAWNRCVRVCVRTCMCACLCMVHACSKAETNPSFVSLHMASHFLHGCTVYTVGCWVH